MGQDHELRGGQEVEERHVAVLILAHLFEEFECSIDHLPKVEADEEVNNVALGTLGVCQGHHVLDDREHKPHCYLYWDVLKVTFGHQLNGFELDGVFNVQVCFVWLDCGTSCFLLPDGLLAPESVDLLEFLLDLVVHERFECLLLRFLLLLGLLLGCSLCLFDHLMRGHNVGLHLSL